MLDNDLIRLNQKVNTVLHLRGKMIESDRVMETQKVEAAANAKFHEAMDEADHLAKFPKEEDPKKKVDPDDIKTAAAGEG
jgi:hypothetical protein